MDAPSAPSPSRAVGYALAALSAPISATFILLTPTSVSWEVQPADGGTGALAATHGHQIRPWAVAFVTIQAVALVCAVAAVVTGVRGHDRVARHLLAVATVTGLVPTVVPGLLAGLAWYLVRRSRA